MKEREAAILRFREPGIITSREVITAGYDTIFDQLERVHLYNQ